MRFEFISLQIHFIDPFTHFFFLVTEARLDVRQVRGPLPSVATVDGSQSEARTRPSERGSAPCRRAAKKVVRRDILSPSSGAGSGAPSRQGKVGQSPLAETSNAAAETAAATEA